MNKTSFDLEKDALIVITPNNQIILKEEKQQKRHKNLFEKSENEVEKKEDIRAHIREIIKECTMSFQFGSKLAEEGYIVLFGKTASPEAENPIGYFQKLLYIPKSLNNEQSGSLNQLLECFKEASKDLIKKGLSLDIHISGDSESIYIYNEDLANNNFNLEKILNEIKQKQIEKSKSGDSR